MKQLIGYCGLDCEKCDVFIATKTNDEELRQKTAKYWSELNNVTITADMMYCDGCRCDGKKTVYCESICEIKKCAEEKQHETCGSCAEMQTCKTLQMITGHKMHTKDSQ